MLTASTLQSRKHNLLCASFAAPEAEQEEATLQGKKELFSPSI